MQIETLREFLVFSSSQSLSLAAKKLHVSKSCLSKHLAKLESEVNTPLFIRNERSIKLTDAGQLLQEYASKLVDLHDKAIADVVARSRMQTITIMKPWSTPALELLLYTAQELANKNQSVGVTFCETPNSSPFEAYNNGEIDCFVFEGQPDKTVSDCLQPATRVIVFEQYSDYCIKIKSHNTQTEETSFTKADIEDISFALPLAVTLEPIAYLTQQFFSSMNIDPTIAKKAGNNVDDFRAALRRENLACVTPHDNVLIQGYTERRIAAQHPPALCLFLRQDPLRPELDRFGDLVEQAVPQFFPSAL